MSEYPNIEISLTKEEKNKIINTHRKKYSNDSENSDIDINEIINIKILLKRFQLNTNRFCLSKNNIKTLILEMKDIHDYKLTTKLRVEFKRKNKTYNKDIYIIMNEQMKKNISLKDNIQYFGDTTYDCVPPQNNKMKLFALLCYNKKSNKILLCMLALIYNENAETLETIFNFLKHNYFFKPDLITLDLGKAGLKAIKSIYPDIRIFPCYFHLIRRIILHIKNLKSKNSVIKRCAKNLLFNIKLLLFIDTDQIDTFYNLIKHKYENSNKNFFRYFERYILKNKLIKNNEWNYFNYLKSDKDSNYYFYTNNVCESLNRTINGFYKYSKKTFHSFEIVIKKIIELYENHNEYIEKNISTTRVFAWFCKSHNIKDLKIYTDFKEMVKEYNNYFQYNVSDSEINEICDDDSLKEESASDSSSYISSNFYSNSSIVDNSEDCENKEINNDNNNNNSDYDNKEDKADKTLNTKKAKKENNNKDNDDKKSGKGQRKNKHKNHNNSLNSEGNIYYYINNNIKTKFNEIENNMYPNKFIENEMIIVLFLVLK